MELVGSYVIDASRALSEAAKLVQSLERVGASGTTSAATATRALSKLQQGLASTVAAMNAAHAASVKGEERVAAAMRSTAAATVSTGRAADAAATRIAAAAGRATSAVRATEAASGRLVVSLGKVAATAATLATGVGIAQFGRWWSESVKGAAAETDRLDLVLKRVAGTAGYLPAGIDRQVESLKHLGIQSNVAREAMTRAVQQGINLNARIASEGSNRPVIEALGRTAQNAAVISGLPSSDVLSGLIHGVTTGQTDVIRYASGLAVSFESSYQRMAIALRKSVTSLTEQEKALARAQEVVRAGISIQGAYEESLENSAKRLQSLKRTFFEISNNAGSWGTAIFDAQVRIIERWAKAVEAGTGKGTDLSKMLRSSGGDIGAWMLRANDSLMSLFDGFDPAEMVDKVRAAAAKAFDVKSLAAAGLGAAAAAGMRAAVSVIGSVPIVGPLVSRLIPALTGWQGAIVALVASNKQLRDGAAQAFASVGRAAGGVVTALAPAAMVIQRFIDENADEISKFVSGLGDAAASLLSGIASTAPAVTAGLSAVLTVLSPIVKLVSAVVGNRAAVTTLLGAFASFKLAGAISQSERLTSTFERMGGVVSRLGPRLSGFASMAVGGELGGGRLASLAGRITKDSPDVRAAQARLEELRNLAAAPPPTSGGQSGSTTAAVLQRQRSMQMRRQLATEIAQAEADIAAARQAAAQQVASRAMTLARSGGMGALGGVAAGVTSGLATRSAAGGAAGGAMGGAAAGLMLGGPAGALAGAAVGGAMGGIIGWWQAGKKAAEEAAAATKKAYTAMADSRGAAEAIASIGAELESLADAQKRGALEALAEIVDAQARQIHDTYRGLEASAKQLSREARITTEALAKTLGINDSSLLDMTTLTSQQAKILDGILADVAQRIQAARMAATDFGVSLGKLRLDPESTPKGALQRLLEAEQGAFKDLTDLYDRSAQQASTGRQVMATLEAAGADAGMLQELAKAGPAAWRRMWDQIAEANAEGGDAAVVELVASTKKARDSAMAQWDAFSRETGQSIFRAGGSLKLDTAAAIRDAIAQSERLGEELAGASKAQKEALDTLAVDAKAKSTASVSVWRQTLADYQRITADVSATADDRAKAEQALVNATVAATTDVGADSSIGRMIADVARWQSDATKLADAKRQIDDLVSSSTAGSVMQGTELATKAATEGGTNAAQAFVNTYVAGLNAGAPAIAAATAAAVAGKTSQPGAPAVDSTAKNVDQRLADQAELARLRKASDDARAAVAKAAAESRYGPKDSDPRYMAARVAELVPKLQSAGASEANAKAIAEAGAKYELARIHLDAVQARLSDAERKRNEIGEINRITAPGAAMLDKQITADKNARAFALAELDQAEARLSELSQSTGLVDRSMGSLAANAAAASATLAQIAAGRGTATFTDPMRLPGGSSGVVEPSYTTEDAGVAAARRESERINKARQDEEARHGAAVAAITAEYQSAMTQIAAAEADIRADHAYRASLRLRDAEISYQRQVEDATRQHYRQLRDMAIQHNNQLRYLEEDRQFALRKMAVTLRSPYLTDQTELAQEAYGRGGGFGRDLGSQRQQTAGAAIEARSALLAAQRNTNPVARAAEEAAAIRTVTEALFAETKAAVEAGLVGRDQASITAYLQSRWSELSGTITGAAEAQMSFAQAAQAARAAMDATIGLQMDSINAADESQTAWYALRQQVWDTNALLTSNLLREQDRHELRVRQTGALNTYVKALQAEAEQLAKTGKIAQTPEAITRHVADALRKAATDFPQLAETINQYLSGLGTGNTATPASGLVDTVSGELAKLPESIEGTIAYKLNLEGFKLAEQNVLQAMELQHQWQRSMDETAAAWSRNLGDMAVDHEVAMARMGADLAKELGDAVHNLGLASAQAQANFDASMAAESATFATKMSEMVTAAEAAERDMVAAALRAAVAFKTATDYSGNMSSWSAYYMSTAADQWAAFARWLSLALNPVTTAYALANPVPKPTFSHPEAPDVPSVLRGNRYDSGGWLPPGQHLIENKTGRPEPVLTAAQWDRLLGALEMLGQSDGRGTVVIERLEVPTDNPREFFDEAVWRAMRGLPRN